MTEELKPGRGLDALIAEKVTKWEVSYPQLCTHGLYCLDHGGFPHYSTDIAAAWTITEKICNTWIIHWYDAHSEWSVKCDHRLVDEEDCRFGAAEPTASLAICLAALQAVGYIYQDRA